MATRQSEDSQIYIGYVLMGEGANYGIQNQKRYETVLNEMLQFL